MTESNIPFQPKMEFERIEVSKGVFEWRAKPIVFYLKSEAQNNANIHEFKELNQQIANSESVDNK